MSREYFPAENGIKRLMQLAKEGDTEAFGRIYEIYFLPVFRYIYFRVQDRVEAEDLTQNVFLKIFNSIENFRVQDKSPLAYFFTVARNTVIDYWRKKKNIAESDNTKRIVNMPDSQKDPKKLLEEREKEETVLEAIKHLTEDQQEVIVLKFIQGFSNKEISKILGKTEDAIRQIQCRALRVLREHLNNFKNI